MRDTAAVCVGSIIDKSLSETFHETDIVNNFMCIKVDGEDGLYVWVRLRWLDDIGKVDVDISNISLPKRFQRQGIFTNIMRGLEEDVWVRRIYVSGVVTPEMHKACRKFKMKYDRDSYTYMKENKSTGSSWR